MDTGARSKSESPSVVVVRLARPDARVIESVRGVRCNVVVETVAGAARSSAVVSFPFTRNADRGRERRLVRDENDPPDRRPSSCRRLPIIVVPKRLHRRRLCHRPGLKGAEDRRSSIKV